MPSPHNAWPLRNPVCYRLGGCRPGGGLVQAAVQLRRRTPLYLVLAPNVDFVGLETVLDDDDELLQESSGLTQMPKAAVMARSFAPIPSLVLLSIALATPLSVLAQPPARGMRAALIPLAEPAGMELLVRSRERADYGPLAGQFVTQENLAYCGIASAVMVLNSLAVPAPAVAGYGTYRFWTQANVFDPPATSAFVRPEQVAREGMTLEQLDGMLSSHGMVVARHYGDQLSLGQFRSLLRRNLSQPGDRMLVNYDRKVVGQAGGGHISPLAAYNALSDRVLILDVARYRYPSLWVPVAELWRAMGTVDASSGRSRGLVTVSRGSSSPIAPPAQGSAPAHPPS